MIGKLSRCLLIALLCGICGAQQTATPLPKDPVTQSREDLRAIEATHPGNTVEMANALINLSQAQVSVRRITPETVDLAQKAVAISEAASGKQSMLYAEALAGFARVYLWMGHPEQGRPLAEQALEIARRTGPATLDLATIADILDKVCWELNDKVCALHAAQEAVAAARTAGNDLYLEPMLMDLANIQTTAGDFPAARVLIEEAIAIQERQGNSDPVFLNNVAAFYIRAKEYNDALTYLNKSLDLSTSMYGPDSVQISYTVSNLANLDMRMDRYADAWPQFSRGLALLSKWYGPTHLRTAHMEEGYATALAAAGRYSEAIDVALQAHQSLREYFSLAIRVMPERQALALGTDGTNALNTALSVAVRHPEIATSAVYQEEIRSRSLVAEEMAQRQASLNRSNAPDIAALLESLAEARSAVLDARGSAKSGAAIQQAYSDATAKMERIERTLAERSAAFRADERTHTVALDDIRHRLPPNSVLISYVAYDRFPIESGEFEVPRIPSYLAFVVHPDSEKITVVDLGNAKEIAQSVAAARASSDTEAHAGGLGSIRNEREFRQATETLRQKIWDPLKFEIGGAKLILVVPDGVLNLIPFAALPDGKGYLVERSPVIHVLSSERDLTASGSGPPKTGLLAVGDPAFQMVAAATRASALRDAPIPCDGFHNMLFQSLPASAAEVDDLAATWRHWNKHEPSMLLTRTHATRERFLEEASRYRMLHVATHAFLLDRSCGDGNPLLHSGLVFAGANHDRNDSVLTAQQIASMNLAGVDWAVLSACNTGNGELRDGEGVMGLERAFRVAGARSVVMTLWPVDDEVTRQFMHNLYDQRLVHHASTADAVWNSARKQLLARRAAGKSTHPWYWAGFVAAGGWE